MKSRSVIHFAVVAAAIMAVGAAAYSPRSEDETIKARRLEQNEAIAQGEFDRVASFWTEDVTLRRALGTQESGRDAYRKSFERSAALPNRIIYQRIPHSIEVSKHWPLAFETGKFEGRLGRLGAEPVVTGRYSAQWVKRGDTWLIRAEVYVALDGSGIGRDLAALP
jgi:ketosteroid isomerase-like protein